MHNISFSQLDEIWTNEGLAKCRDFFVKSLKESKKLASKLINDTRITFPCFFILMPVLEGENIHDILKDELKVVFNFAQNIMNQEPNDLAENIINKTVLKWMFDTSYNRNGLGCEYNEIIDVTASILINTYKDITEINKIASLIFLRNRQGENIHELVRCYFQINTPLTLKLIALRLKSKNALDVKLARKLLNFKGNYNDFNKWISKNEPFLFFTGESFQYSSNPVIYSIDFSSKYLLKAKRTEVFSNSEILILNKFKNLSEKEQDILSDYSFVLSKADKNRWNNFIENDIMFQLKEAKDGDPL